MIPIASNKQNNSIKSNQPVVPTIVPVLNLNSQTSEELSDKIGQLTDFITNCTISQESVLRSFVLSDHSAIDEKNFSKSENNAYNALVSMMTTVAEVGLANTPHTPRFVDNEENKLLTMCINPREIYHLLSIVDKFIREDPNAFTGVTNRAKDFLNYFANAFPNIEQLANDVENTNAGFTRAYTILKVNVVTFNKHYDQVFVATVVGPLLHKNTQAVLKYMTTLHTVYNTVNTFMSSNSSQYTEENIKALGSLCYNTKQLIKSTFVNYYAQVLNLSIWTSGNAKQETITIDSSTGTQTKTQPTSRTAWNKIIHMVSVKITPPGEKPYKKVKLLEKKTKLAEPLESKDTIKSVEPVESVGPVELVEPVEPVESADQLKTADSDDEI